MGTLNNPGVETVWKAKIAEFADKPDVRFVIGQLEKGEAGTLHLQFYVEFTRAKTLGGLKKYGDFIRRAHFEQRRGTQAQAIAYVTKDSTSEGVTFEFGLKARSSASTLAESMLEGTSVKDLWQEYPGQMLTKNRGVDAYRRLHAPQRKKAPEVEVIFGPPGTGKSYYARHCTDADSIYTLEEPRRGAQVWFDGYDDHEVLLIDEFRGNLPFNFMLRLLDEGPMQVQVKGGFRQMTAKRVIITTNVPINRWYPKLTDLESEPLYRRLSQFGKLISMTELFDATVGTAPGRVEKPWFFHFGCVWNRDVRTENDIEGDVPMLEGDVIGE